MKADGMGWLINFIFTGIGGLVGYLSAAKVSDRKETQQAGIAFYNSFNKIRMRLDPRFRVPIDGPHETKIGLIIKESFAEQTEAMLKFRFYLTKRKSKMITAEKEKAATNLSIKLKNDLPPNIVFSWDDNYVLTFTTNGKLLYKYYYDNHLPNEPLAKLYARI